MKSREKRSLILLVLWIAILSFRSWLIRGQIVNINDRFIMAFLNVVMILGGLIVGIDTLISPETSALSKLNRGSSYSLIRMCAFFYSYC